MTKLTDFQEVVGLALDVSDEQAAKVQKGWPPDERALREALKQWRTITGSAIRGLDLLTICTTVWQQRPDDLATVEGRSILYHPAEGSPIAEGSPLDDIPAETLAFLKWSLDRGALRWSDEITIAREVKGVGSIIADLPGDRFYGKHSLPYTGEGAIDWGDLALARAKDFVRNGPGRSPFEPPAPTVFTGDDTLVGVLCSIPGFRDIDARTLLLRGLLPGPVGAIRRSSAFGTDIANLVEAVTGFGRLNNERWNERWAINILIDNAIAIVRGTETAGKLTAFKR